MGLGAIGPGVGEGIVGGKACEAIARNPETSPVIVRTMLVGQAVAESTGIYALVVSLLLIFVIWVGNVLANGLEFLTFLGLFHDWY